MTTVGLVTDSNGNVITMPLTGWNILPMAGSAVLLQAQYVETPEELERREHRIIQLALTPPMALELAEALSKVANPLMSVDPKTPIH
ncbi:MAG: hypothetical protein WA400_18030 [Silvibacterium sp.]